MAIAVVDTNVLIDYKDSSAGDRHIRANAIIHGIDSGDLPTGRVTEYIVLETLNWIHERHRHDIAIDLYTRLVDSAGFEIVNTAQKDYHRAVEIFERYGRFSFGDATIIAYMEREDIELLYSFDGDFDGIDQITRLDTADNPVT